MALRSFSVGVLGPSPLKSRPGPRGEHQALLAGSMAASLAGLSLLLFLIFFLLFVLACRPWRFFSRRGYPNSATAFVKVADIEQPLLTEHSIATLDHINDLPHNFIDKSNILIDGDANLQKTGKDGNIFVKLGFSNKISTDFQISAENLGDGQMLKRPAESSRPFEDAKHARMGASSHTSEIVSDSGNTSILDFSDIALLRSSISLEVVAGPSIGIRYSRSSTENTLLPLMLGRVSPCDLILKDSEVSGKHAFIDWNVTKSKWELVDLGSLNGTFVNSKEVHHSDAGSRHRSEPADLSEGDIITLGTASKISVQIVQGIEYKPPFEIGIASDPMAMRRGGKKLPMEDMCYCKWPLPGAEQFGLFCIFDGHGGAGAARAASKLLPQTVASLLSIPDRKQKIFTCCDASDVLKEAFSLTEATLNHQYEGCTATVLLLWLDSNEEIFVQCANVGDSACILDVSGKQITMTEDHRVTSISEQARLCREGNPLKEGETRLCGLNLVRMLGDKFLKEQDVRFSAEPYVSPIIHITKGSTAFGILASDGLWDVMSTKQAVQLVIQMKERYEPQYKNSAQSIANYVLSEAATLRTKDNTTVIFIDFHLLKPML